MVKTDQVREQYQALSNAINRGENLDRRVCSQRYPDLIDYVIQSVDLANLIQDCGIPLKPLSPDRQDILVGVGCPACGSGFYVKRG